jgi:thiol-disulfide isomerase/thioredoxin
MSKHGLKIAHITIDGNEIDGRTKIKPENDLTQESSELLRLYNDKKPMFIKFYATWCGHCKTIDEPWKKVIAKARTDSTIKNAQIAIVEVESNVINKEINKIIDTPGLKKVDGYPTIGMITYPQGNALFTPYNGARTFDGLFEAVQKLASGKQNGGSKRTNKRKTYRRKTNRRKTNRRKTYRRRH